MHPANRSIVARLCNHRAYAQGGREARRSREWVFDGQPRATVGLLVAVILGYSGHPELLRNGPNSNN